jgi:hypothetical protein
MAIHDSGTRGSDGHDRRFEFLPVGPLSGGVAEIVCVPPYRWAAELAPLRARVTAALLDRARGWWGDAGRRHGWRDLADLTACSLAYLGLIAGLLLVARGLALAG